MKIEEHLVMIEEQKSIRLDEEQWLATKEGMSMNEAEFSPFSEKVISWAEDEVGVTEEEEDETSVFVDQVLQRTLQGLAEKNYSLGSKTFVFPEVLKADSTVDLYFNRDLSALAKEPNILIKGAFNGWKWSFFTEKLHMSELEGEWWCCKLYIPKQAYRLDFVFFNNDTVYENNENNDFMIQIESTMDEHLFEDFLVEEKQRELEKLAIEEAERRRHAEKQQRMEEKRAEHEADKAQANAEVEMKKNKLQCSFSVKVPQDAYMMDFVFSESKEGGVYDNRNGLDYHIPVFGSTAKESPLHVVQIAVEMAPIAKVGGLADVVTSLSRAVQDLGHNVEVILPKHDCLNLSHSIEVYERMMKVKNLHMHRSFSFGGSEIKVWHGVVEDLRVYFLEPQNGTYYTAMIGQVSNAYSREVSGHGAITPHLGKFYGILNGIDPDIWDPYNDNLIPIHYTSENVVEGKSAAKKALQQKLGLEQNDVPLVGIVTRLTGQKGIHLIKHAIHQTLERNGQVVLLGSAPDPRIQGDFVHLANTLLGIYAGSDFILVPSIFEPCGLTQLVAMRAISAWFDARSWFHSLCKRVMEQDWSWNRPALDYIELYHSASKL
nr:unnamed protein product [Digitaria exilis]